MSIQDEINEKVENFKANPIRYLKSFAMDLVVVIVAIAYVFYQMVKLEPTETSPIVLIAKAFMGIVCGVVIKAALGENGFSKGYNSDKWADEEEKYNQACNSSLDYMDRVDNFYQCEEIENKKKYRRAQLQACRLKYDNWFDDIGNYIGKKADYDKLDFRQKFVIKKCVKVKIYPLNLFSQYAKSNERYTHKEITDRAQRSKNITKNTLSATLIAIVGVYFIPALDKWSWASFISSTMQVSMWVLFGVIQLYTNYNFVVNDKVDLLREKKEHIKKFNSGCEEGKYKVSPYDEERAINELKSRPIIPIVDESKIEFVGEKEENLQDITDKVLKNAENHV